MTYNFKEQKTNLEYVNMLKNTSSLYLNRARDEAAKKYLTKEFLDSDGNPTKYSNKIIDYKKLKDPEIREKFTKEMYSNLKESAKEYFDIDTKILENDTNEIKEYKKAVEEIRDDIIINGLYGTNKAELMTRIEDSPELFGEGFDNLKNHYSQKFNQNENVYTTSLEKNKNFLENELKDAIDTNKISPLEAQKLTNLLLTTGISGAKNMNLPSLNQNKLEDLLSSNISNE